VPERVEEILLAGKVAHVACVAEEGLRIVPFLYGYSNGRIVLKSQIILPSVVE
jgi:nitroimidazol reductase NimA-like FMN-containing flavoprotein (pyridoxamine 5'-phosphate oxidase superfamily)